MSYITISIIKPKYECSKCKDTGKVNGKDCECLTKEMSRLLFNECGLIIQIVQTKPKLINR